MVANKKKKRKIVADMEMGMVADKKRKKEKVELDIEVDMVADMEVDKVADMEEDNKFDININMEIQFGERVGHGGWLIGPKLFWPKAIPVAFILSFASLFHINEYF